MSHFIQLHSELKLAPIRHAAHGSTIGSEEQFMAIIDDVAAMVISIPPCIDSHSNKGVCASRLQVTMSTKKVLTLLGEGRTL